MKQKLSVHTKDALKLLDKVKKLIGEREIQYGHTWVRYGYKGNLSHVKEKCLRLINMTKKGYEPLAGDTLADLIVWSTFALVCLRRIQSMEGGQPLPYVYKIPKKELYGSMSALSREDMFVLSMKFVNGMYQNYFAQKSITNDQIDDLIDSLRRMKKCRNSRK